MRRSILLSVSSTLKKPLTLGALLLASVSTYTNAHPVWVLPHEFVVSSERPEWVTFDVTASHTYFNYDKGLPLHTVSIHLPDGDKQRVGSYFKGHRRSVFDLQLTQDGTYRIEGKRPPYYFTEYKAGKRDTVKRMMADKVTAAQQLPKDARDVKTYLISMTSMTFVTNNKPTNDQVEPKGKGLEIKLNVHPNDIVQGDEVEVTVLVDGQPTEGATVEVTPGGTKYRDERGVLEFKADAEGKIRFTPEQAGPWVFYANHTAPAESKLADEDYVSLYMTFEVQPE